MSEKKNPQQPSINIEVSEEVAEGVYSNLAIISHSNSEFVIDFIRMMPNVPKAKSEITHCAYTTTCQAIAQCPPGKCQ